MVSGRNGAGRRAAYPGLSQEGEELAALDKVHDHVEVSAVGKGAPESDDEGMLDVGEHAALVVGVLDLLHLDHLGLFEHLDGIVALVVFGLHQMDPAEATGAEGPQDVKVAQRVLALGDAGDGALAGLVLVLVLVVRLLLLTLLVLWRRRRGLGLRLRLLRLLLRLLLLLLLLRLLLGGLLRGGGLGKGLLLLLLQARGVGAGARADGLVDRGA